MLVVVLAGLFKAVGVGAASDLLIVLGALFFGLSLQQGNRIEKRNRYVLFYFVLLGTLYFALTIVEPSATALKNTINIFVCAVFYLYFFKIGVSARKQRDVSAYLLLGAFIIVVLGTITEAVAKNTVSGLAIYPALTAGAILSARSRRPVLVGILVLLAISVIGLVVGHRTVVGMGLGAAFLVLMLRLVPSRLSSWFAVLMLALMILFMIAFYTGQAGFDIRSTNEFFSDLTGRNAQSGRQIIWPIILKAVAQEPYFGLGPGAAFSQLYYDTNWSAHSYFLQVYMQVGIVGLTLLIGLLVSVWRALPPISKKNPASAFALAIFVIVVGHSALAVFLMQVNIAIGVGAWMALGVSSGLSQRGS